MKYLRVSSDRVPRRVISEFRNVVEAGGLVIYPTDTVYGLGCTPFNEGAVKRVFEVKGREFKKPLPVLVSCLRAAQRVAQISDAVSSIAESLWPGALTIIVWAKEGSVPEIITAGTGKIGIRMPNSNTALRLIEAVGGLLVGTSANISGGRPPADASDAIRQLGGKVDLVVDAGRTAGAPSTVLDLTESPPRVVRRGPVGREAIERKLKVKVGEQ